MRADWTRYDDNITRTLNSFGRSGVPTYALYVPGELSPPSPRGPHPWNCDKRNRHRCTHGTQNATSSSNHQ